MSTGENIESVQELVLSQESQPDTHRSVRKIARETDLDNHRHQVYVFRTQHWKKVKERIVLREIHFRTTGRHLSMGSHSVICHPTEVTAPPSPQPGRLVLDLSTP